MPKLYPDNAPGLLPRSARALCAKPVCCSPLLPPKKRGGPWQTARECPAISYRETRGRKVWGGWWRSSTKAAGEHEEWEPPRKLGIPKSGRLTFTILDVREHPSTVCQPGCSRLPSPTLHGPGVHWEEGGREGGAAASSANQLTHINN